MTLPSLPDKTTFLTKDTIKYIWKTANLPESARATLNITGNRTGIPSSMKVGHIAQASIILIALGAVLIRELRNGVLVSRVEVPLAHAYLEFNNVDLWSFDGRPPSPDKRSIGGVYMTSHDHVKALDGFPHHHARALEILDLPYDVTAEQVRQYGEDESIFDLNDVVYHVPLLKQRHILGIY